LSKFHPYLEKNDFTPEKKIRIQTSNSKFGKVARAVNLDSIGYERLISIDIFEMELNFFVEKCTIFGSSTVGLIFNGSCINYFDRI